MSYVQSISQDAGGSITGTGLAFTSNNTAGNTLFFAARCGGDCTVGVTDTRGNAGWVEDVHSAVQSDDGSIISLWSCPNCAAGANTVNFTFSTAVTARYAVAEYNGMLTSGVFDVANGLKQSAGASTTTPVSNAITPSSGNRLIIGVLATGGSGGSVTAGSGYTLREAANASNRLAFEDKEITSSSSQTAGFTLSVADTYIAVIASYKEVGASGPVFDAAGNSGDQAAANSYSGSASWSGTNRMLAVDVSLLGAGVTVTSMTYGGAACTKIGSRATVTSLGSVECWRICSGDPSAPGTGSNTLVVNLSSTIEFAVEWASYTNVEQTQSIESFNSNQATNSGSATDASVVITTTDTNTLVHAAVVANKTSITAGQTSRNNISGTLGSGGNEDNTTVTASPSVITMSYTGMGITTTWAIAGYAIRAVGTADIIAQPWHAKGAMGIMVAM